MKYAPIQNFGTQETANLCRCNNCETILIDENPQANAQLFELTGNEESMEQITEADEIFMACPRCKTDAFLVDLEEI